LIVARTRHAVVEVEGPLERGVAGGANEASRFQDGSHALRGMNESAKGVLPEPVPRIFHHNAGAHVPRVARIGEGDDAARTRRRSAEQRLRNKRLGACGFGTRARGLGVPGVTQLDAAREDEGAGLVHAGVDTRALDGVAGSAAGHEIARIFLSLTGAGNDEIHTHDQGVLETGAAVKAAVLAAVIIAFQNLAAFFHGYR